jgi:hypothetical protein
LASATSLDQEHIAEDGLLGENQRGGREAIEVAEQAAMDLGLARAGVGNALDAAVGIKGWRKVVRQIGALDATEIVQAPSVPGQLTPLKTVSP